MNLNRFQLAAMVLACLAVGSMSFVVRAADTPAAVKHVDAVGAKKLVDEKKVVVLDVRTPKEFASGHIAGATNIDFNSKDFEKRVSELDTNKAYLVHCAAGGRSTRCLPILEKKHFNLIYHLDGGINGWERAGNPVEK